MLRAIGHALAAADFPSDASVSIALSNIFRASDLAKTMNTALPVLNDVDKASIHERQPLPEAYLGLPDVEMAAYCRRPRGAGTGPGM